MAVAEQLRLSNQLAGSLYDYVDPASGTLMVSTNSHVFSEVELVETFLKSSRAGGFRVV